MWWIVIRMLAHFWNSAICLSRQGLLSGKILHFAIHWSLTFKISLGLTTSSVNRIYRCDVFSFKLFKHIFFFRCQWRSNYLLNIQSKTSLLRWKLIQMSTAVLSICWWTLLFGQVFAASLASLLEVIVHVDHRFWLSFLNWISSSFFIIFILWSCFDLSEFKLSTLYNWFAIILIIILWWYHRKLIRLCWQCFLSFFKSSLTIETLVAQIEVLKWPCLILNASIHHKPFWLNLASILINWRVLLVAHQLQYLWSNIFSWCFFCLILRLASFSVIFDLNSAWCRTQPRVETGIQRGISTSMLGALHGFFVQSVVGIKLLLIVGAFDIYVVDVFLYHRLSFYYFLVTSHVKLLLRLL